MWFTRELLKNEESVIGFLFTVSFQFYKCVCVRVCVYLCVCMEVQNALAKF